MTRGALAEFGGTEVKTPGDGFLASFTSAQRALECAQQLQRSLSASLPAGLTVRIGVNAGEPILEGDDLFGASVIAAPRIAAQAGGGEILVAAVVRQLVLGKGFLFTDRDHVELRGLEEPVRVWELRWGQGLAGYRPVNFASRFSWNARTASPWSSFFIESSSSASDSGSTRFETSLMYLFTDTLEVRTA